MSASPSPGALPPSQPSVPWGWKTLVRSGWVFVFCLLGVLTLLLSAKRIHDYDLGTHLRSGQWIVQNHAFPSQDTFTYTQNSRDYLDPNGLYQVLLYFLEKSFGYPILTILIMLVVLLVFLLLIMRLRFLGISMPLVCLGALVTLLMLERRFVVRPEVFTWLFLSLTLIVLDLRTRGRDFLFLLPLIQLLWVNMEGLFILGWFVMLAYAFSGRFHQKRWDPKLARYGLLSLAADCFNPYFLKGVFFPFFLATRLGASNLHKQTIVELYDPWHYLSVSKLGYDHNLHVFFFLISVVLGLGLLLATRHKRAFHEWALFGAFSLLGLSSVRNIPLFAVVTIPILVSALSDFTQRFHFGSHLGSKPAVLFAFFIALWAARVSTNAYYIDDRRVDRMGLGLNTGELPVKATEFLRVNGLNGRLLNTLNFGGWLAWDAPQPTFIDGRSEVMEDGFYRRYMQSLFNPDGLLPLLNQYQPQLILTDYKASREWPDQVKQFPDWRLIYLDECSALYARSDYAQKFPAVSYSSLLSERNFSPLPAEEMFRLVSKIRPSRFKVWLTGFFRPQDYPMDLFSLGLFAMHNGEHEVARCLFTEGLMRAGGGYREVFYNLGLACLNSRERALGKLCLEKALQLDPNDAGTKKIWSLYGL
jgi:hypothetical protein